MDTQSPGLQRGVVVMGWARSLLGYPISPQTLGLFFDSLAALLHAGHSLPQAMLRASSGTDPELRHICETAAPALSRGVSLSRVLRPHAHRFPELVLPLLEVGEMAGTIEVAARRLADNFRRGVAVERRFKRAVFDPWLVILALAAFRAITMVGQPVLEIARAGLTTLLTLAACYLGGRLMVRWAMRWPWLRLRVDTIKVALPHMGTVLRNLAAARWARSFATLWGAGVPISPALEVSSHSALNAYYERAIQRAARQTRHGATLHQSLEATQLLPPHLMSVIATGETTGHLSESLERLAAIMEDEAFTRATQEMIFTVVAGEILLAVIAVGGMLH